MARRGKAQCDAMEALVRWARYDIDCKRFGDLFTASHIAISHDNAQLLRTCLELGACSEPRNGAGDTPQQYAYLVANSNPFDPLVLMCQEYGAAPYQLEYAGLVDDDVEDANEKIALLKTLCANEDFVVEDLRNSLQHFTFS